MGSFFPSANQSVCNRKVTALINHKWTKSLLWRSARKSPRPNRYALRRAETALRIASSFITPGRRFLRNGVPRFHTIWQFEINKDNTTQVECKSFSAISSAPFIISPSTPKGLKRYHSTFTTGSREKIF